MSLEDLIKENKQQRDELLRKKAFVKENNIKILALIIDELYHLQACSDIELKVLIQEEDCGSLFSNPQIIIKPINHSDIWIQKDPLWIIESISENQKTKREHASNIFDERSLGWSDNIIMLINEISTVIEEYEWDHFNNIGRMKGNPLWKSYQDEEQKNTREYVWIASLSRTNFIETLHVISAGVSKEELKELIVQRQKERLEIELAEKNPIIKNKTKI